MTQQTNEDAVKAAWPTIKELLEKEVINIIRKHATDSAEAGAIGTAAVRLIDSIDSRYGEPIAPASPIRRSPTLRTSIQS